MQRELKKHGPTKIWILPPEVSDQQDKEEESGGHQGPVDLPNDDTTFKPNHKPKEEEKQLLDPKKVKLNVKDPVKDRVRKERTDDIIPEPPANPKEGPIKGQKADIGIKPTQVSGQSGKRRSHPSDDSDSGIQGPGGGGKQGGIRKGPITVIPGGGGGKGDGSGKGVGVGADISGEKRRLIDWVLKHQGPLPPVVERSMVFDAKKDVSALDNVLIQERGDTVFLFFVYRQESNLLRAMAIRGRDAFLFSLPGFELKARYIKIGRAELEDSGVVTDVQFKSTDRLPDAALSLFNTILNWLDIKEETDRS